MQFWRRYRTIILGTVATVLLVSSAIFTFDVDWRVMLHLLAFCLLLVAGAAAAAAFAVSILVGLRRLLRGRNTTDQPGQDHDN